MCHVPCPHVSAECRLPVKRLGPPACRGPCETVSMCDDIKLYTEKRATATRVFTSTGKVRSGNVTNDAFAREAAG